MLPASSPASSPDAHGVRPFGIGGICLPWLEIRPTSLVMTMFFGSVFIVCVCVCVCSIRFTVQGWCLPSASLVAGATRAHVSVIALEFISLYVSVYSCMC